jgi:hypothetical protein
VQLELVGVEFVENCLQILPQPFGNRCSSCNFVPNLFRFRGVLASSKYAARQVQRRATPLIQSAECGGFDRPKFDESQRAGRPGSIPELVETHFASVGITGDIGLKVAGVSDQVPMIAGRKRVQKA